MVKRLGCLEMIFNLHISTKARSKRTFENLRGMFIASYGSPSGFPRALATEIQGLRSGRAVLACISAYMRDGHGGEKVWLMMRHYFDRLTSSVFGHLAVPSEFMNMRLLRR